MAGCLPKMGCGPLCKGWRSVFLFQVVTLPVEFNASRRALNILEERYVSGSELKGAKKMLNSAALTYVAAMLASLLQLIRLLVIRNSRD